MEGNEERGSQKIIDQKGNKEENEKDEKGERRKAREEDLMMNKNTS